MKSKLLLVLTSAILALLSACSAIQKAEEVVASVEQGNAETRSFQLSPDQAEEVIRIAFKEGWPDKELTVLGEDRIGYEIRLWFAIDREHVSAEAIKTGAGYSFRVINRGTAPVVGVPARKKLIELLEKHGGSLARDT